MNEKEKPMEHITVYVSRRAMMDRPLAILECIQIAKVYGGKVAFTIDPGNKIIVSPDSDVNELMKVFLIIEERDSLKLENKKLKEGIEKFEESILVLDKKLSIIPSFSEVNANKTRKAFLEISIDMLELSVRSYNILVSEDIRTIGDLVSVTRKDLLSTRGCGMKVLREIIEQLGKVGLFLKRG